MHSSDPTDVSLLQRIAARDHSEAWTEDGVVVLLVAAASDYLG
jgi:hypothetical protein